MQAQPYLFFDGRCEEAIEFYRKTLGAHVEMLMRFKDNPDPQPGMNPPGSENKVMHAAFRIGETLVMGSDGRCMGKPQFQGFSLSLDVADEAEADKLFAALGDGGQVQMPQTKTFFSPRFGMVADRFGVSWMIIVSSAADPSKQEFVISRDLNAPRDLVWKAFTDPEHMKQWWGPKGFKVLVSKMDLRPGGTYHYGLQAPDGSPMWGRFVYREIVPKERLVFLSSFSDEAGGITRHPMSPNWPREMLSTFTFEDLPGGKTRFTVRWSPHQASEAERKVFADGQNSMRGGWTGTLQQLEAYLAKAR